MTDNYSTYTVEDLPISEIARFMDHGPVLFVGSHISSYSPTNLPTGQSFGWALFEYIFKIPPKKDDLLSELYSDIPFEALMETCPDPDQALAVLANVFQKEESNAAHHFISQQLNERSISALITPDYDMTFDMLLKEHNQRAIVTPKDLDYVSDRPYFKIHGSADQPETMVYNLKQEGELDQWKYEFLTKITQGRNIIFVGYSGRDFDICPMIAFEKVYDRVIWLHYGSPDSLSPYARFLLNSNPANILVTGDFCKFISKVFDETIDAKRGDGKFVPEAFGLNDNELLIWQLKILERLAFAKLGLPLLRKSWERIDEILYLNLEGNFYAHQGRYKAAAKQCIMLFKDSRLQLPDRIQQLISAIGTYRAYGNYFLAWIYNRKLKNLVTEDGNGISETLLLRLKLTFLMTRNQYCQKLGLDRLSKKLVAEAQKKFDTLYDRLIHNGEWSERQIVQHMAERMKLNLPDRPLALTADVGFRNLGMPGMDIISVKDLVRSGDPEKEKEGLKRLDDTIKTAKGIGMYTETWKHNRLKILHTALTQDELKACFSEWWDNLSKCEYFFFTLRLLFWLDYFIIRIRFLLRSK